MKKIIVCFISLCFLCSCGQNILNYNTSDLKKLTGNYSLESAKQDGCLVMENGDVTAGQEIFDQFLKLTQQNQDAKIRLVNYYTIGDKSQYSEELYIQEKDKYPQIYVADVVYENDTYTAYYFEEEKLYKQTYKYMIKDEFTANPEATFTKAIYYILVNDKDVTWNDIFKGMVSSQFGAGIAHYNVYQKHIYK